MLHLIIVLGRHHGGGLWRSPAEVRALLDAPEPEWKALRWWNPRRWWLALHLDRLVVMGVAQIGGVVIATVALWVSYGQLRELALLADWSGLEASIFPLVVDAPAILATVGIALGHRDHEVEEQAAVEPDDTEQQRPTEVATEAVAERVDERLQAAVSQPVIAEQRVSSELSVGHAQAAQPSVEASVGPFAEGSPSGELNVVAEHVPEAADTDEQPVTCDVEFAEQVRAESRTKADTETVARVVGLWQQGAGVRAIGREVSMSPSTVSSVTKTAERLLAASDDEGETARQLSVVGG